MNPALDSPPRGPSPFAPAVEAIEGAQALDAPAGTLAAIARSAVSTPPIKRALRGDWLGHAVHPLLSDVVVGALLSATLLDLFGGDDDRRAPTALTGLSDWSDEESSDAGVRRAGVAHALSNSTALALYAGSMTAGPRRAVALRLCGAAVLGAGAYLGGHLTLVKGVGIDAVRGVRTTHSGPAHTAHPE
jgi:hypothetical protein